MWPAGRLIGLELTAGRCSGLASSLSAALGSSAPCIQQLQSQASPGGDAICMQVHGFASAAMPQLADAPSSSNRPQATPQANAGYRPAPPRPPPIPGPRTSAAWGRGESRQRQEGGGGSPLSPEMSRFEAKLEQLEKQGSVREAAAAFETMMQEGMDPALSGGAGQLSLQYRPSQRMMDFHLRRLQMVYSPPIERPTGPTQQRVNTQMDTHTAQEFLSKVLFAGTVCDAAGLRKPAHYYEAMMKAHRALRNTAMVMQTYAEAKAASFHNFNLMYNAYLALVNDKHYSGSNKLERLQTAHGLLQDMIKTATNRGPREDDLVSSNLNRLLRSAIRLPEWSLVTSIRLDMQKAGYTMDPDIHLEYLYYAALHNDVIMVEQRLTALDKLAVPIRDLPAPYRAAIPVPAGTKAGGGAIMAKLPEGVLLEVMHCALRNSRPELAERAFALLTTSLQRSSYCHPQYYHTVQPVEDQPNAWGTAPPPALPQFSTPSRAAHHALVHTLVEAKQWAKAWEAVSLLEGRFASTTPSTVSPYHGLSYFARALVNVQDLNGALTALTERMEAQIPPEATAVTSSGSSSTSGSGDSSTSASSSSRPLSFITPISILMRGTALRGAMDDTNKLFRFMQKFGERPNADVYTAVLETAVVAKKMNLVPKTLDYIRSPAGLGAPPGPEAYDILLRGYIEAQDCDEFLGALSLLSRDAVKPRAQTLQLALKMATGKQHHHAITRITTSLLDADEPMVNL